tara:strand:- start:1758 stop:1991 length:234 start_codon:yes stop_codon:yes gene_type:complete
MELETEDLINSPSHYRKGGVECIDAIKAALSKEEFKGYLKAAAIKYIWRENHKESNIQDLKKSVWYLNRLIQELEDL